MFANSPRVGQAVDGPLRAKVFQCHSDGRALGSVDDLAQHLGVFEGFAHRWIEKKGLPARKVGRLWRFKLSEVDDWVRAGETCEGKSKLKANGKWLGLESFLWRMKG